MAIENKQRGFVLLIAVIFMTVMLTFGLTLGSLGYKQQVLASSAIESQYAFYAADTALECALYADQQQNIFAFPLSQPASAPAISCDGSNIPFSSSIVSYTTMQWVITERFLLDSGKHCADITVYKPPPNSGKTYLFSQGYNVSCATVANPGDARVVSRGLWTKY